MAARPSRPDKAALTTAQLLFLISFCGGSKGGVGKSFFCRMLYEYHKARGLPVVGFEGNIRTPDFADIYAEIKANENIIHFSENESQVTQPKVLLSTAVQRKTNVVVNMPASVEPAFQAWLDSTPILKIAREKQLLLLNWFICSGEYDSNAALKASLRQFGSSIPHIVVKNLRFSDWSLFSKDRELQQLIEQYECKTIHFPRLNVLIAGKILEKRLTYTEALNYTDAEFDFVDQSSVESFLNEGYAEVDRTGLFTHAAKF